LVSVVAMFLGALVGAVFVVHHQIVLPLVIALVAVVLIGMAVRTMGRSDAAWVHP
jgi:hypothetical protein